MKCNKSAGLAKYRIEFLRQHNSKLVWHVLALLFNQFVKDSYPAALNRMLFVPLHKKGPKQDPDNYRGISLIHPIGRLFSKAVTNRLEMDNKATRAAC